MMLASSLPVSREYFRLSGKPDEMLGGNPCDELASHLGVSSNTLIHLTL